MLASFPGLLSLTSFSLGGRKERRLLSTSFFPASKIKVSYIAESERDGLGTRLRNNVWARVAQSSKLKFHGSNSSAWNLSYTVIHEIFIVV